MKILLVVRAHPGRRAPVLARATLRVAAGQSRRPAISLTSVGRRTLRRGRSVKAVLGLTVTRRGSTPVAQQRNVKLRGR